MVKKIKHSDNCKPDENKNTVCEIIGSFIEKATTSEETVPAVYKKTVASIKNKGLNIVQKIPSYEKFKSVAYRRIRKINSVKKMAYKGVTELEIPLDHKDFCLADYSHEDERILVFASEEARELLKIGKIFFCDGTFKKCPKPFTQLYVFFCDLGSTDDKNFVVPVVYVLLTNKKKETYILMMNLIKSQIPEWGPSKIISDFEQSFISAVKVVFPMVEHHGCFYHFQNQLRRKAKSLNLKKTNATKIVSLCTILPLLPESKIEDGFRYIIAESDANGSNKNLQQFINYVARFWMPKKKLWCCFGERHRTNNVCEGWNGHINNCFKRRPATVSHCLKVLKEDAAFHAVNALTQDPYKKRSKEVRDRNNYIQYVQMQLINSEIDIPLFLEKLR